MTETLARAIRRTIVDRSWHAGVGHIGSALSIADLVAVLHGGVLRGDPDDSERDRFVLSKGHAALALYAALLERGEIDAAELERFCGDGTVFGTHPEHVARGIDFTTGSLGHGLSFGAGAALAARLQGSKRRAFVLLSDAECNEGSVWEAVMFAAHHRLGNLVAVVDCNGQQALGHTRDVLDLSPLLERWQAFGWDAVEADGHDHGELRTALEGFDTSPGRPHVLVARTTFGHGVSFMEGLVKWHYSPLSADEYSAAIAELA